MLVNFEDVKNKIVNNIEPKILDFMNKRLGVKISSILELDSEILDYDDMEEYIYSYGDVKIIIAVDKILDTNKKIYMYDLDAMDILFKEGLERKFKRVVLN